MASSLLFPLLATASGISTDCGDMTKAVPSRTGDLTLVRRHSTVLTAEGATSMGTYPGRWIEARDEAKAPGRSIVITLKHQRNDPAQALKDNAVIIERTKEAEKTLGGAAAKGIPEFQQGDKNQHVHARVAPLSKPEEAVVTWHEDRVTPTAAVHGTVYGTVSVMINMTTPDIEIALNTLNQINSRVDYSIRR